MNLLQPAGKEIRRILRHTTGEKAKRLARPILAHDAFRDTPAIAPCEKTGKKHPDSRHEPALKTVKEGRVENRMNKKGQKSLEPACIPGLTGLAKHFDCRTVRVKIREKTAGKRREIPL